MFPKGILLNNPGNIRHSHDFWNGQTKLQDNKEYVRFSTPQAGIRAMMKIITTYKELHHICTIKSIIERYAPPNENNTYAYVSDISQRLGVPDNFCIDISKPEILMALTEAMVIHEQGHSPPNMPIFWYDETVYYNAAEEVLYEDKVCY